MLYAANLSVHAERGRRLLGQVSVLAAPGRLTGVLGPSGAGKTTLLNALLGRIDAHRLEPMSVLSFKENRFRALGVAPKCGYVMAKDCLYPYLTVRETLCSGAQLRLPESLSPRKKQDAIGLVVGHMRLHHCLDLLVGDDTHAQGAISKGERRRLAIALELLSSPQILVLDEPTSGIDSALAFDVVSLLSKLCESTQITVFMTLHQPSQRIMDKLDHLILLLGGHVIYQGVPAKVEHYLHAVTGIARPAMASVADYALEVISLKSLPCQAGASLGTPAFFTAQSRTETSAAFAASRQLSTLNLLTSAYHSSVMYTQVCDAISALRYGDDLKACTDVYDHRVVSEPQSETSSILDRHEIRGYGSSSRAPSPSALKYLPTPRMVQTDLPYLVSEPTQEDIELFQLTTTPGTSWYNQFRVSIGRAWLRRMRSWRATWMIWLAALIQATLFGLVFFDSATAVRGLASDQALNKWPVWDSKPLQYLAYGLNGPPADSPAVRQLKAEEPAFVKPTRQRAWRVDPFLDLLKHGVDQNRHTSLVLDMLYRLPEWSTYLSDVTICYRKHLPQAALRRVTLTPWNDPTNSTDPAERLLAATVAVPQILWVIQNYPFNHPSIQHHGGDMVNFFIPAALRSAPFVTPLMCCLGHPFPFAMVMSKFTKNCSQIYRNYDLPKPPVNWQWQQVGMSLAEIAEAHSHDLPDTVATEEVYKAPQAVWPGRFLGYDVAGGVRYMRYATTTTSTTTPAPVRVDNPIDVLKDLIAQSIKSATTTPTPAAASRRRRLAATGGGIAKTVEEFIDIFGSSSDKMQRMVSTADAWIERLRSADCAAEPVCRHVLSVVGELKLRSGQVIDTVGALLNVQGVILFLLINVGFMSCEVLTYYVQSHRVPFNREKSLGIMNASSYLTSNMLVDAPFHSVVSLLFTAAFLLLTRLPIQPYQVASIFGVIWLFSWSSYSVAYLIASLVDRVDSGIILLAGTAAVMLVVTGMFVNDEGLPRWITFFRFLSIYRFGYSALVIVQFPENEVFGILPNAAVRMMVGLQEESLQHNLVMLLMLGLIYRVFSITATHHLYGHVGKEAS